MQQTINVQETVWIEMPDGVKLAAKLWLPEGAEATPVPCILEYIPYRRRDRTRIRDDAMHPHFAKAGYAAIRVDMRGSGDSGGLMEDEYSDQEISDGADVIAWIAAQPWCDGAVGMFGKSWGAYSAFQVAARRPAALKAIAPVMGCDDRWREDIHFYGGCLAGDNFWWGSIMQLFNAMPPDPDVVGQGAWRGIWRDRLEAMSFWPMTWLEHQTCDAQWRRGSICENYEDVDIPVYYFGGWADLYRDTPFRIAANLRGPVKVLMGPWGHLYPHEAAPGPQIDFVGELLRFWDHTLRGKDTGLMEEPRIRAWMQDPVAPAGQHATRPGRWVEEPCWPSPNIAERQLWLNSGTLDEAPEEGDAALRICSPADFGASGGDMCSFAIDGDMPGDARADAGGALLFRAKVEGEGIEILGQPRVDLCVSADRAQGFAAVLLIDEAPDGAQSIISRGFCNFMHRHSDTAPTPIVPGEEMRMRVDLHAIAHRLVPGHRLMVQLASTYWPILWPAPEPVTLSLMPGRSCLHLPIRKETNATRAPRAFAAPRPAPAPPAMEQARPGALERTLSTDLVTGERRARVFIDGGVFGPIGRVRLTETGTEIGDVSDRIYSIHPGDPLSARAEMTQSTDVARGNWQLRIETHAEMRATAEEFHLTARVKTWEGDTPFHEVAWEKRIPRNGM